MTQPADTPLPDPVQYEPINVTQLDDGTIRINTAPLPEHTAVGAELWGQIETYDPYVNADTGIEPPPIWLEQPPHAGHVDADGNWAEAAPDTILHIDATNVTCTYQLVSELPDGTRVLVLKGWGER